MSSKKLDINNQEDKEIGIVSVETGQLVSELRQRTARSILRRLHKVMTPSDALVFSFGMIVGVFIDNFFFQGGLQTPVVSLLNGAVSIVVWKLWNNTHWQKKRTLKMIKDLQKEGLITEEQGELWRKVIVEQYITMDDLSMKK